MSKKRERLAERAKRHEAGEAVSDSSSVKEYKKKMKARYLADLKK